jgi:hypothetical protein
MPYINDPGFEVPENSILFYPDDIAKAKENDWKISDIVDSLVGKQHRDYFAKHAYLCLPLTIANQSGFVVKSNVDMTLFWPGGESRAIIDLHGKQHANESESIQNFYNNFGSGIVSIANSFILRTPPGINLMTIQPPNYFIPGAHVMTGIVEADNLRGHFTFNLKVTTPGIKVHIKKGDWLGAFIPTPRYFIEQFKLIDGLEVYDNSVHDLEKASIDKLKYERNGGDLEKNIQNGMENTYLASMGRRYFKGIHPNDKEFIDHQKRID